MCFIHWNCHWQYCYLHYFSRLLHLESFSRGETCVLTCNGMERHPNVAKASQPGKLSTSNVAMIVIGLLFFIAGVGISVVVVILLSQRTTKGTAWCFPTLFLVIVTPVLETVL
ncbi:hypothetical protein GBAR_LOCUS10712 [Geodia barretti]|uniref:Uncharacterized protein n=1 Tax=Geodia barretti TaxID=519541 RepID=A0AA35RWM1_GEOBA|nr:hypothetical protein GBAR_LOCUS10712 [Geodia barretti]